MLPLNFSIVCFSSEAIIECAFKCIRAGHFTQVFEVVDECDFPCMDRNV